MNFNKKKYYFHKNETIDNSSFTSIYLPIQKTYHAASTLRLNLKITNSRVKYSNKFKSNIAKCSSIAVYNCGEHNIIFLECFQNYKLQQKKHQENGCSEFLGNSTLLWKNLRHSCYLQGMIRQV